MNTNPLLEPGNHALLLIDHQYLQLLTLRSHEASQVITNATAVAKAAKIFDVPTLLTTAFAERQNLTMRMSMRRFTRLTNAFSKKVENHAHAVALHFMFYNFGRIHKTLRVTPAMQANLSDHI